MQWCLPIGGQASTGKASGSGRKARLTRYLGECNVCKDYVTKSEKKEIKDEPVAGLCSIDAIGGHAKSDQYGRSVCRLRHRSARAFSRQAFLRQQDSRYWALWNLEVRFVLSTADIHDRASPPVGSTGTGLAHGFVLACWFRNAASPASDTSTHFLSGAASAT